MKLQRIVAIATLLFMLACNVDKESKKLAQLNEVAADKVMSEDPIPQEPVYKGEQDPKSGEAKNYKQSQTDTKIDWDKKIVKKADISVEVNNARKYRLALTDWISASGGYVAKEEQIQNESRIEDNIIIKVPVDQFESLLSSLFSDSVKVIKRTINTEDVTGEYVDIRSRLESKRQVRLRYLDFLEQAKNMEEVLLVQKEVNDLQEQIESAAGRISYLSQVSAFSTINLSFYEADGVLLPKEEDPSYLSRFVNSLKTGASWVGEILLIIVSIWPFFLVVGLVLIWYRRKANKPAMNSAKA